MAAPVLQAEGALTVVTTGNLTVTLPTHQAGDILILAVGGWVPVTAGDAAEMAAPAGWTQIAQLGDAAPVDGRVAWFWKRATSGAETNPAVTRPTGWDTGTDTAWGGRAYTIRGCITTGDPWDEADPTAVYTTANQPVDALTVAAAERLAVQFLVKLDDFVTAPTVSGWTAGAQVESTTGTDHSQGSFRKDNVSANTAADASTVEAPAQGWYAFLGISFKPPATGPTYDDAPAGGVQLAGSAATTRELAAAPAGGIVMGGVPASTISATYTSTPSAGLDLGGTATTAIAHTVAPAGAIALGGPASSSTALANAPAGGLTLAGAASSAIERDTAPAGGVSIGGTASAATAFTDTPAGGIELEGAAASAASSATAPAGGLALDGAAASSFGGTTAYNDAPAGGITLDGSSSTTFTYEEPGSGGIRLDGATSTAIAGDLHRAGGIQLIGFATTTLEHAAAPAGGIALAGTTGAPAAVIAAVGTRTGGAVRVGHRTRAGVAASVRAAAGVVVGSEVR